MGAEVEPGRLARRRRLEAVRALEHRARKIADRGDQVGGGAKRVEVRQRLGAELQDLLLDACRRAHRAAAEPSLEEVRVPAGQARVGRAEEREEVAAVSVEPGVAEEREQRLAERRLSEADAAFQRIRHTKGREGGVECSAPAVEARADDADLLGRRAGAEQPENLLGDELERSA